MRVISEYGKDDVAKVYVAEMGGHVLSGRNGNGGRLIEFVESLTPSVPREEKWVLILSSLYGCPVKCVMCDAGGGYKGKLTAAEIMQQVDYIVRRRYPDGSPRTKRLKIQFARMGEPAYNPEVLNALRTLPTVYDKSILHISLSTIAPDSPATAEFFDALINIKNEHYGDGRFQLQFSIHTTDANLRDRLMPIPKWPFEKIAEYGSRFAQTGNGDKKVTLNFAPIIGYPIDPTVVRQYFDPEIFLIKLTPLNPTVNALNVGLVSGIDPDNPQTGEQYVSSFRKEGYDVILSIGEPEENRIGSNCGQYVQRALASGRTATPSGSYELSEYTVPRK